MATRATAEVGDAAPVSDPADDQQAREQALDVTRSWIVEAPAGSGKTGLLIQRYLKLLGSTLVREPEQVLGITFTRAATEEMRSRIVQELDAVAEGRPAATPFAHATRSLAHAVLARDQECGWGLRENLDRIRIRSIDSVSGEIARMLPLTSGGAATARPIDDAAPLYQKAARRTLLTLGGPDTQLSDAVTLLLLHRDGNLENCERLIAEMLGAREQWYGLVPARVEELADEHLEERIRPQLDRALDLAICTALTRVVRALPTGFLESLTRLAALLSERPGYKGAVSPIALCRGKETPPDVLAEHLEHWRALTHLLLAPTSETWRRGFNSNMVKFVPEKDDKELLRELIDEVRDDAEAHAAICALSTLPPARYPDEQWIVTKALLRVLQRALTELNEVFVEDSECDFAEPALLARAFLREHSGQATLEMAGGVELRHLLVDEMQDTSTGQYELLELLTAGWEMDGRTLFLVGDPKQSIYLFRQARVDRFVRTLREQRLGSLPLGRLRLSANFRSAAGLVASFNQIFSRVFPAQSGRDDGIVYAPAKAARSQSAGGISGDVWHLAVVGQSPALQRERARTTSRKQARDIREIIAAWRRTPLPPGRTEPWRIAVLVASRRELQPVVTALRQPGDDGPVPFRAINVEPLGERTEILDLLALTRALKHPADRTAWWSLLRAPWCGLTLQDLHLLAGTDDPEFAHQTVPELLQERGYLLNAESRARLEHVRRALAAALIHTERTPLPELIERTWRALRGDAYLDATGLANSRQYFHLIETLSRETGSLSTALLTQRLERLYAAPEQAETAVDLMTIHGAKGLEWDVVLLPELERRAPVAQTRLLEWEELSHDDPDVASLMLAPIAGKGEQSGKLNRWLRQLHTGRLRAERRRQLYVACTRAREELHLFATATEGADGLLKHSAHSLLEAAWPAAKPHFDDSGQQRGAAPDENGAATAFGHAVREEEVLSLAAEEEDLSPMTTRLPLASLENPLDEFRDLPRPRTGQRSSSRPLGSYAARSFGNAVHTFLELAADGRLAARSGDEIGLQIKGWQSRIRSVLRAEGLPPAQVLRLERQVQTALINTLRDPTGQWLLGRRHDARSEHALTLAGAAEGLRIDRVFRAGPAPLTEANSHLWIIDYKTASHGGPGIAEWLEQEKQKYSSQMERYARALGEPSTRLGLWYPMMTRLIWWET